MDICILWCAVYGSIYIPHERRRCHNSVASSHVNRSDNACGLALIARHPRGFAIYIRNLCLFSLRYVSGWMCVSVWFCVPPYLIVSASHGMCVSVWVCVPPIWLSLRHRHVCDVMALDIYDIWCILGGATSHLGHKVSSRLRRLCSMARISSCLRLSRNEASERYARRRMQISAH